MPKDLIPLSAAAHALVAPNASPAALAPLADAYATAPAQPPADIKLIETYAHADKSKLQALADDGDVAAKELLEVFRRDRAAIMAMSGAELSKQAKRFDKLVGKIEDEFNKGKPTAEKRFCPRNPTTNMPTGFLPTATPTKTMLLVAHVAIAVAECDARSFTTYGTTPFKSGCWWLAVLLIAVHWLRDGGDDPALGLQLDISGAVNVVLKLSILTHIDNLIPSSAAEYPRSRKSSASSTTTLPTPRSQRVGRTSSGRRCESPRSGP